MLFFLTLLKSLQTVIIVPSQKNTETLAWGREDGDLGKILKLGEIPLKSPHVWGVDFVSSQDLVLRYSNMLLEYLWIFNIFS